MIYFNNDIKKINYQGYDITRVYACGGELVWNADVSYKFVATYNDGRTYSVECDGNTELTTATTKPSGYTLSAMTSAEIGDCVTRIGNMAFGSYIDIPCITLSSITIPNSVTMIDINAFANCSGLTSVVISSGVTSIGSGAFYGCTSLKNINLPNSVTSIGRNAFYDCSGLTSITVNTTTPPSLGEGAFDNTNDCPIYVPCQSVDAYKTAWSTYANRIACVPPAPGKIHFYRDDLTGNTATTRCVTAFTDISTYIHPRNYEFELSGDTVCGMQGIDSGVVKRGICTVILPENTKRVEDSAFYRQDVPSSSSDLPVIVLNDGLETIGIYAFCGYVDDVNDFAGCGIIIPDSVTSIGYAAFNLDNSSFQSFTSYNSKIKIYFKSQIPPTMNKIFGEVQSQMNYAIQIYVPTGTTNAYREALGSQYNTISIEEYDGNITYLDDFLTYERLSTQGLV